MGKKGKVNKDKIEDIFEDISDVPDAKTKSEEEYTEQTYREQLLKTKARELQAHINNIEQNTSERKKFAELIYILTVIWLILVLSIVISTGHGILRLSDKVLITLITTSTVNVLAFFTAVTLYLFNKNKST